MKHYLIWPRVGHDPSGAYEIISSFRLGSCRSIRSFICCVLYAFVCLFFVFLPWRRHFIFFFIRVISLWYLLPLCFDYLRKHTSVCSILWPWCCKIRFIFSDPGTTAPSTETFFKTTRNPCLNRKKVCKLSCL